MENQRPFDIAIFGCTGNAGRAVALHTLKMALREGGIKVALAGRNKNKVNTFAKEIFNEISNTWDKSRRSSVFREAPRVFEVIQADAMKSEEMLNLARSTKVLVACAGPYGRYGEASVKAAVEGKCHYVDITGETPWVQKMVRKYGDAAKKAGITLCSFSGYDCVPAEFAMVKCQDEIERNKDTLVSLDLVFKAKGGGLPRGTIHTLLDGVEHGMSFKKRSGPRLPGVIPPPAYKSEMKSSLGLMHWLLPVYTNGRFTGPNFMSAVNVPVMLWSSSQLSRKSFRIRDRNAVGPSSLFSLFGLVPTLIYEWILFCAVFLLLLPPVRWFIRRFLKTYTFDGAPKGVVTLRASATSSHKNNNVNFEMKIPGDPGIYATGLLASAVAYAILDCESSSGKKKMKSGFVPPVAALNESGCLDSRLKIFGVDFSLGSKVKGA